MVVVWFSTIREWIDVLRCWVMWRSWIDKKLPWWCVKSWDEIRMVHQSLRTDLRVADELYITRVSLALEDFLFFSIYSFFCIAKQPTTLKQFWLLFCLNFLNTSFARSLSGVRCHTPVPNITYTWPRLLDHNQTNNIVPDIECAYIPRQGVSIVPNLALFLVGVT
jgi:hypothetical protein